MKIVDCQVTLVTFHASKIVKKKRVLAGLEPVPTQTARLKVLHAPTELDMLLQSGDPRG